MLEGLTPKTQVRNCAIRTILNRLDDKDKIILETALKDLNTWRSETLARALADRGIVVSGKTITYHRNEGCSCFKA